MPYVAETVVTTKSAAGEYHIAPLGLIAAGQRWIVAPFRPSRTLDNLLGSGFAVASHVEDVRVIAGCVTGRRDWPLEPVANGKGARLKDAVAHWELEVESLEEDPQRPRFTCRLTTSQSHRPWGGFNRAQAAVLEAAVLMTRLKMLPPEKIDAEVAYLTIAIEKTAGPREREAWGWLMERLDAWRAGDQSAARKS